MGTVVVTGIGAFYVYLFDITEKLPSGAELPVITITNGDWDAAEVAIIGTSIQRNMVIAHLSSTLPSGLPMRVNYRIDYA